MRASFLVSTMLAGLALCSAPAWANSWHHPNVYEESNGEYTNYTYDDGLCRYTYNANRYENRAQASRYGDCAHLMIGPDGRVLPMAEPIQQ
jgi:hypothetical protein